MTSGTEPPGGAGPPGKARPFDVARISQELGLLTELGFLELSFLVARPAAFCWIRSPPLRSGLSGGAGPHC